MKHLKLAIISAAYYPADAHQLWMLRKSAEHFHIPLQLYGVGQGFVDWTQVKYWGLMDKLRTLQAEHYSHVLYTDAVDSMFVGSMARMEAHYALYDCPPLLMSGERNCWPDQTLAPLFEANFMLPFAYPCAGQFMGDIGYILDRWPKLQQYEADYGPNDQAWIQQGYDDGLLDEMQIDDHCLVFQNMNGEKEWLKAAVLHFSGGYCDPQEGRLERMMLTWTRLFGTQYSG